VEPFVDWERHYVSDDEKMDLAIALSRENVIQSTGGPFGALVLERDSGRLLSAGVNIVVPARNSVLHAEIVAFMMAQQRVGFFSLGAPGMPEHELVTSCDPCAMCLAAILWAGVTRVVCGASHKDAKRIAFDEGPVFSRSHAYMQERGVEFVRGVRREEARAVLELYAERGGVVYNG
jgi:tRNA(Arg) A34 adenosine deaminase TadA